jgi:predicted transcriptional regulator
MARHRTPHPTDVELEILSVLWEKGSLPLSRLCRELRQQREVATTTVATMLRVMADKGLVVRNQEGHSSLWSAVVTRKAAAQSMIGKLVDRLFDGSAHQLVTHLVDEAKLTDSQIGELQQLLAAKQSSKTGKRGRGRR